MIRALFFGPVADRFGARSIDVDYRPELCLHDVQAQLARQSPEAFEVVSFIAVNGVQVRDLSMPVADGSEIAFMAKFSGG